jgi:glucose/arabinose dehydrogenase
VALKLIMAVMIATIASRAAAIELPPNFEEAAVVPGGPNGLAWPVGFAFLPDGRVLIIQQSGEIRLVVNGTLVADALLAMPEVEFNGERGLLGIAVDPDFPARPFVYVLYSDNGSENSHLARYALAGNLGDPNSTNLTISPTSKQLLINQIPDVAGNHNGGTIRFGLDNMLYISIGDDADACAAQDLAQLKGKILRVKVDDSITPLDLATMVPAGNPFAGSANVNARLVWAYGLRNPFRFSIDPLTGAVFVGDVGNAQREEASRETPTGGDNFGWPYFEGTLPFADCNGGESDPLNLVAPILEYVNAGGTADAIIGGPVYKSPAGAGVKLFPPNYQGVRFAADYYRRFLYALRFNCVTGIWEKIPGATPEFWATDLADGVADMAVGPDGALYYLSQSPGTGGAGSFRKIRYIGLQPGANKTFTVPPCRVLDTRNPGGGGVLAGNACRNVRVTGSGLNQGAASTCGVPTTATGVHVNVVAVGPTMFGHLTVFPFGWSPPLASTINFTPGQNVANGILLPICDEAAGSTCMSDLVLQAGPSASHVVIDVTGYTAAP